jgi:hypothetical protein
VDQGNIVIAGNAVAQGVEPLIYPLHNDLVRQTVAHMHQLCMPQILITASFTVP